jgi:hypothetical protein
MMLEAAPDNLYFWEFRHNFVNLKYKKIKFKCFCIPVCSFLLAQKRTKKGSRHLFARGEYPMLLAKNRRLGMSHPLAGGTPPSRFSVFCCAARLREMANLKTFSLFLIF